jgi:hypothetical protein
MSPYLPSSQESERSDPLGADHVQWYVLGIVFDFREHSVDDGSSTPMASKSRKDMSQQTSCEAGTGSITRTQPRKCSHHDQRLNEDKAVHKFTSNNNHMSQINSGNSDEKADTTSSAVEYHHSLASSREDALFLISIGSQFEEMALQNVREVALEENFTPVEPVHCPYTTSGGIQRGPMDRYLSEAAEEGPWMGEEVILG